jgi:hypothetical protein
MVVFWCEVGPPAFLCGGRETCVRRSGVVGADDAGCINLCDLSSCCEQEGGRVLRWEATCRHDVEAKHDVRSIDLHSSRPVLGMAGDLQL